MGYVVTVISIIFVLIGGFFLFIVAPLVFIVSVFATEVQGAILSVVFAGLIMFIGGIAIILEDQKFGKGKQKKVKIGNYKIQKNHLMIIIIIVLFFSIPLYNNTIAPVTQENIDDTNQIVSEWDCTDSTMCIKKYPIANYGTQSRTCTNIYTNEEKVEESDCTLSWPDNALELNENKRIGIFSVTLNRIGFYKHQPYSFQDAEDVLRLDMTVENIGEITESFSTSSAAIIYGNQQYDTSYFINELDTSDLRPGVVRSGYILFKDVPNSISGEIRIDAGSAYWYSHV